jgi:hypothetical protein
VTTQQNAGEQGKRGLPSELSFNVDPCVAREVSPETLSSRAEMAASGNVSPGGNASSDFSDTTPTARYGGDIAEGRGDYKEDLREEGRLWRWMDRLLE